ncbi:hypothetical protein AERO8C_70668 [Aeromonas veronii]|uniref:Uncharacterized protein n=1 Tax=Aeromonas veronii TaxID=654 RepID=A0A653LBN5_AERVE|nr:hypothetical protein AERO8C_70668 [Aeromonas veronii]
MVTILPSTNTNCYMLIIILNDLIYYCFQIN